MNGGEIQPVQFYDWRYVAICGYCIYFG